MNIKIDPKDMQEVRNALNKLSGDEVKKATVRSVNKTMTGVRTDGIKILTEHYALTASAIRESWKIRKAYFNNPLGVVSSKGTFIRLIKYGGKQVNAGVSVRVLKSGGRKIVKHAFIAKLRSDQSNDQVYRREWHDNRREGKASAAAQAMARKGYIWSKRTKRYIPAKWMDHFDYTGERSEYRLPVRALYGPRIQDYLSDPIQIKLLTYLAGQRLIKNVAHEVDYLLSKTTSSGGEE